MPYQMYDFKLFVVWTMQEFHTPGQNHIRYAHAISVSRRVTLYKVENAWYTGLVTLFMRSKLDLIPHIRYMSMNRVYSWFGYTNFVWLAKIMSNMDPFSRRVVTLNKVGHIHAQHSWHIVLHICNWIWGLMINYSWFGDRYFI